MSLFLLKSPRTHLHPLLQSTVLSEIRAADHPILKFTQDRRIFRLLLIVGVVFGVVAGSETGTSTSQVLILNLRITSVVIFLFLTLVQALQTAILATSSASGTQNLVLCRMNLNNNTSSAQSPYYIRDKDSVGVRFGNHILLVISLLLIIREVFSIATVKKTRKQYDEHLWYPLISLPEVLIVILYITPGLVPRREELQQHHAAQQQTTTEYKEMRLEMGTVPAELPGSNLLT